MAYKIMEPFWDQRLKRYFKNAGEFYPQDDIRVSADWLRHLLDYRTREGKPILADSGEDSATKGSKKEAK